MAAPSPTDARIDIGLEAFRLALGDLHDLAHEWPSLTSGERASWSTDWDQLMTTYLPLLDRHYRDGLMMKGQRLRYRTLICSLRTALPLIEQLDLCRPTVPLDD